MKKLLLILLCVPLIGFGQTERNKEYWDDGQLKSVDLIYYKDGKEYCIRQEYYKNSQLKSQKNSQLKAQYNFKEGKLDGIFKMWYLNNQLRGEGNWKDGNFDGAWKEYYESGKLKMEFHYKDGKINGIWKGYYESGQLASEGNYIDGNSISAKCWDEEGNEIECQDD